MKDIFITSAVRTAVGSLGKTLKNISAEILGSKVITEAINKSNVKINEIDEVILGQVLTGGAGQNPARQAAIKANIPIEKPAYVVNQVCGSGLRSVLCISEHPVRRHKYYCGRRSRKYVLSSACFTFKRWKEIRGC